MLSSREMPRVQIHPETQHVCCWQGCIPARGCPVSTLAQSEDPRCSAAAIGRRTRLTSIPLPAARYPHEKLW
jgi:hypothetical protein